MTKLMYLHAATDKVNSECSVCLDITEEEWNTLSDEDQQDLIDDFMSSVVDIWVDTSEEEL